MATYLVKFVDEEQAHRQAVLSAPNEELVRRYCASKGYSVVEIRLGRPRVVTQLTSAPASPAPSRSGSTSPPRVSAHDLSLCFTQLGWMMTQGVPVHRGLRTVASSTHPGLAEVLASVIGRVESGTMLSTAMAAHEKVFPLEIRSAVHMGEESGRLAQVLSHLGQSLEKQGKLRKRLISLLIYPLLVTSLCFGLGMFMLLVMLPQILGALQLDAQQTPALTRFLMFLSSSLWVKAALGLGLVAALSSRQKLAPLLYNLPTLQRLALANWLNHLVMLLSSGIDLYHSLRLTAAAASGPRALREALPKLADRIRQGSTLAEAFQADPQFPPGLGSLTACAEEVGSVEDTLRRYSDMLTAQVTGELEGLLDLLEPLLIGAMGALVGLMVVGIFLPLYANLTAL